MGHVVILGVFVADTAYRAERMPVIGETVLGTHFLQDQVVKALTKQLPLEDWVLKFQ